MNAEDIKKLVDELLTAKSNVAYCLEHPNGSVNFHGIEYWAGCVERLRKQVNEVL